MLLENSLDTGTLSLQSLVLTKKYYFAKKKLVAVLYIET